MKISQYLTNAVLLTMLALNAGCSCCGKKYDPNQWHASFVAGLNKHIGANFEQVRIGITGGWAYDRNLMDRTELQSGHIAYKYHHSGSCNYIFEVNPNIGEIVAVNWEGDKRSCTIMP